MTTDTAALFAPYLGTWTSQRAGPGQASGMSCRRIFTPFGAWVRLEADWGGGYQEVALFGRDEAGALAFWSFTADGGRSQGAQTDASDVHPQALAFVARMPAGMARMVYWPADQGFNFAVENETPGGGWNRFMQHRYTAAA